MFQRDQPLAADFPVAVGYPDPTINRMTLLIGPRDVLQAMTEPDIASTHNTQISNCDLRPPLEMREEIYPILPIGLRTTIFLPWHDVKNDKTFVRYVILHHRVDISGVKRRRELVMKRPDRRFISGRAPLSLRADN